MGGRKFRISVLLVSVLIAFFLIRWCQKGADETISSADQLENIDVKESVKEEVAGMESAEIDSEEMETTRELIVETPVRKASEDVVPAPAEDSVVEAVAVEVPGQEVKGLVDTVTAEPNDTIYGDVMAVVPVLPDTMDLEDSLTKASVLHPLYFSVGAGAQMYFGMNDSKMFLKDRVTAALKLTIGWHITNVIGIDLGFYAAQFKGVCSPMTKDAFFLTSENYKSSNEEEILMLQNGYYMNLSARMMVDFTNWFGGVNPVRRSAAIWYVGGGWAHGFGCDRGTNSPSINSGFIYNYYFTPRLALDIDLYGALVGSYFEGEHCNEHLFHGFTGIMAGITYRF